MLYPAEVLVPCCSSLPLHRLPTVVFQCTERVVACVRDLESVSRIWFDVVGVFKRIVNWSKCMSVNPRSARLRFYWIALKSYIFYYRVPTGHLASLYLQQLFLTWSTAKTQQKTCIFAINYSKVPIKLEKVDQSPQTNRHEMCPPLKHQGAAPWRWRTTQGRLLRRRNSSTYRVYVIELDLSFKMIKGLVCFGLYGGKEAVGWLVDLV